MQLICELPSTIVLWLLAYARGVPTIGWRGVRPLALLGLPNSGLSYTFSMLGLSKTTASVATLLWAAEPVLILLLASLMLREVITIRLLASVGQQHSASFSASALLS
jgi:drug/metabolite transporter (DMT)-like permease